MVQITIPRHLTVDWSPSANGDFNGMVTFYPLAEIKKLRKALLFSSDDALRGALNGSAGELWLPTAAGTALDIEITLTWPTEDAAAAVPAEFGSVGVKVLGVAPALVSAAINRIAAVAPPPAQPVAFDLKRHGPGVTINAINGRAGSVAVWGGKVVGSKSPGPACNQVALLANSSSFWMVLGPRANPWTDLVRALFLVPTYLCRLVADTLARKTNCRVGALRHR